MVDILQDFERLADDRMAFGAFDTGDKAPSTGVMFIARIVEPLRRWITC